MIRILIQGVLGAALMGASFALTACSGKTQDVAVQTTMDMVLSHPRRDDERARDKFRHPKQTLEFFELAPGQTVAEIWPGWYTNIIAPYLAGNEGAYIAVLYPDGVSARLDERLSAFKTAYGDVETYGSIQYGGMLKGSGSILPADMAPGSVDRVLSFRNVHNWMAGGYADQAFASFYAALKPGGILGIVEHRLPEAAVQDPKAQSGYVQESYIKDLARRAGFEFVESSEINANPRDMADHPFGVWTLPPRSRLPESGSEAAQGFDAQSYREIGESDRATLKFRKAEN